MTTDELDLSVLARVSPPDEPDEKPGSGAVFDAEPQRDEDEPPRRRRREPRARAPRTAPESPIGIGVEDLLADYKPGMFVEPFTKAYMTISALVMPFSEPIGISIAQNAEPCAIAWDNAAKLDKRIRVYLLKAMVTGTVVPLLVAHLPIMTVIGVVVFGPKMSGVQSTEQTETVNPVSNGYQRR
jgi:hypothetical protein